MKKQSVNQVTAGKSKAKPEKVHGGARKGAGRKPGIVSQAKVTFAGEARKHAAAALKTLAAIVADVNAPPAARVSAANSIIDRAHGRPMSAVEITGKDGNAIEHTVKARVVIVPPKDIAEISTRHVIEHDSGDA
ncbi:hypothetical protein [Yoonia sp.]|uniref:hypothetical protein n=1 Tax=Yoonia sp. TaxID=2212373 RepID=UPI002E0118EA|nr:hypothetical protein [Yoonia sp.]